MKLLSLIFTSIILFASFSCEEKDAPFLQGDINGQVALADNYGFPVSDRSGVRVQLSGENTEIETITDSYGHYSFQDLLYGKYDIRFIKENFFQYSDASVNHIGGDAPTLYNMTMNEVPEHSYVIDSMIYYQNRFRIYTHIIGATQAFNPSRHLYVHCFFSQSPDVSCENFEDSFMEMAFPEIHFTFYYGYNRFLDNYSGTVYCRIYAQAEYYGVWQGSDANPHPIKPETLGPPSEVFSFTVAGITRTTAPSDF